MSPSQLFPWLSSIDLSPFYGLISVVFVFLLALQVVSLYIRASYGSDEEDDHED